MLLLASGRYSGAPESNLVFIGIPIGYLIRSLYQHFGGYEWYTLTLIGIQIASFTALAMIVVRSWKGQTLVQALYLGVLITFQLFFLTKLQFTTTAAIATTAGVACLFATPSYRSLYAVIGMILLFIGINLRVEAGILAIAMGSPMLCYHVPSEGWERVRQRVVILATVTLMSLLIYKGCAWITFQDPMWQEYNTYNVIRGEIHGRHLVENPSSLPPTISYSDYQLLRHFFQDPRLSASELEDLNSSLSQAQAEQTPDMSPLREHQLTLALVLLTLGLLGFKKPLEQWAPLAATGLLLLGVTVASTLLVIFKLRVFMAAMLPALLIPLVMVIPSHKAGLPRRLYVGLSLCLCALIAQFFSLGSQQLGSLFKNRAVCVQEYQIPLNYHFQNDDRPILADPSSVPLEWFSPFKLSSVIPPKRLLTGGWLTRLPYNSGHGESFSQAVKTCVFLVDKGRAEFLIPLIVQVLNEQGVRVEFQPIKNLPDGNILILQAKPR